MKRRVGGKAQVKAVLTSDLDEGAKVLWAYLAVVAPGGAGRKRLEEDLGLLDFEGAVEILEERTLAKRQSGKLIPLPPLLDSDDEPPAEDRSGVRAASENLLQVYNSARRAAGFGPISDLTEKAWRGLDDAVNWLTAHSIAFQRWVDFTVDRAKFMSEKGLGFPNVSFMTGPWLRQAWQEARAEVEAATAGKKAPGHAGRSYDSPLWLRTFLIDERIKGAKALTDPELRHIYQWARNMIAAPEQFPEPDEQFEEEITALVRKMRADSRAVSA